MPRLILVYPRMGRHRAGGRYVRSWEWEPLAIGILAGLTPAAWEVRFFDDRVEPVDYDAAADLVGISIETYSARRGYQIAARFRERGIPVVFGGYHATACPEEALEHGDAVCVGEAEPVWGDILAAAQRGSLTGRYQGVARPPLGGSVVDRRLFAGKGYLPIALVEVGRGCPFQCEFCSISAFYGATYRRRPAEEIAEELRRLPQRRIFLVDDNLTGSPGGARELFQALRPLKKEWMTQTGMVGLEDTDFVAEMADSGCIGVLIGFESLNPDNLKAMKKGMNRVEQYGRVLDNLRRAGIFVYGTFLFGYPGDTPTLFAESVRFAVREKMFIAAFNHLVPFPGTPLYRELEGQGRMRYPRWWMSDEFRFGQVPFDPVSMSAADVEAACLRSRRDFFGVPSTLRRALDLKCNCATPARAFRYFAVNRLMRREVGEKRGIPLGGTA